MHLLNIRIGKRNLLAVRREGKLYPVFIKRKSLPTRYGPYNTIKSEGISINVYNACDREIPKVDGILSEREMTADEISQVMFFDPPMRRINLEHYGIIE